MKNFSDKPIESPNEDRFGFNAFAQAIAETIQNIENPDGSVIAINGPWGTGKSSIVNLIKHHLNETRQEDELKIVDFNCWWFRGEEALALEFFRELYSAMDTAESERAMEAISQLGSRILSGSSAFIGAAVNFFGAPGAGGVAAGSMNILSDLIKQEKTVQAFHKDISDALSEDSQKFLIVIDDIDRLSPDEALLIFRLVKSVGRLPNVTYLLAYDRAIAEKIVSDRYPSEGPQYLEKIVQAGFDIPSPPQSNLVNSLLLFLNELWADESQPEATHFWNLMHDVVIPEIKSPRDVHRIINTLGISWRAVAGEVDPVEFLCIETLRVQRPVLYNQLRNNRHKLTDEGTDYRDLDDAKTAEYFDAVFLNGLAGEEKNRLKTSLRRLFPALDGVWGNTTYVNEFFKEWEADRRICSKKHFNTYFRFTLADDNISKNEISFLIEKCDEKNVVSSALLSAIKIQNAQGGTRAALLLEELNLYANSIPLEKASSFLSELFSVHDEINIEADEAKGFGFADNSMRTHWIVRSLLVGRTELEERSLVIMEASANACLGWLVRLASRAYRDHYPAEGKKPQPPENCLTTKEGAAELRKAALTKIEQAAADNSLLNVPGFIRILYEWSFILDDESLSKAKDWCLEQAKTDLGVECLASAFVTTSWSQGLDDYVAVSNYEIAKSLHDFFELDDFKSKVEELLSRSEETTPTHDILTRFIAATEKKDDS